MIPTFPASFISRPLRLARLRITGEALLGFFQVSDWTTYCCMGIPRNASLFALTADPETKSVALVLEAEDFPLYTPGEPIPEISATVSVSYDFIRDPSITP